ncbi:HAMP domain-containing sensor histidine kinase [Actinoplanes sp. NPDC051851]|uniref:sensor histidine kinase n=1 Tax=Actinoplanes sp. NPDC051851 TaxID=3154753 RepID=UPI00341731BA
MNPAVTTLSRLGHELRGPLTGIIALTNLMSRKIAQGVDPARITHQLALVNSSASELLTVAERVSDLARLDGPPTPGTDDQCFDCALAVREKCHDLNVPAGLPHHPVLIRGNPDGVRRMIAELLDNAVKYADRPAVTVTADVAVTIEIRDHGPGLTENELQRIADPFERGLTAHTRGVPGSGLGLNLADRLAARSGGVLTMTSSPEGTVVTVTFPKGA